MEERRSAGRLKSDERLRLIVNTTLKLIEDSGFETLSLTKVIEATGLPRSTFLGWVPNMPTLVVYLNIEAINRLLLLVNKSSSFVGCGREHFYRFYTAGLLFLKLEPALARFVYENLGSVFFLDADETAMRVAKSKVKVLNKYVYDAIEMAIVKNEISVPPRISSESLALYLMSAHIGICQSCIANGGDMFSELVKYKYYIRQVIDKLPWHPTSVAMDYDQVLMKIVQSYYMEEYQKIGGLGTVNID